MMGSKERSEMARIFGTVLFVTLLCLLAAPIRLDAQGRGGRGGGPGRNAPASAPAVAAPGASAPALVHPPAFVGRGPTPVGAAPFVVGRGRGPHGPFVRSQPTVIISQPYGT